MDDNLKTYQRYYHAYYRGNKDFISYVLDDISSGLNTPGAKNLYELYTELQLLVSLLKYERSLK